MIRREVIIVGGVPGGSSCAWELKKKGTDCLILDKKKFPRLKICAGWITPKVIKDLKIKVREYPQGLISFNKFHVHYKNKKLGIWTVQHSIRRVEFDDFLLKRSNVSVENHQVNKIEIKNNTYIIDGTYSCKYLVGAGGTYCPVQNLIFNKKFPNSRKRLVFAMEEEYQFNYHDKKCYLWFFENNLFGYSWYVPKSNGYINIGIGGLKKKLKRNGENLKEHWDLFIEKLIKQKLINPRKFNPKGHIYYVKQKANVGRIDNAFIIGDSAGLATKDLGEGIGPAVESGLKAAKAILNNENYSLDKFTKYSIPGIIKSGFSYSARKNSNVI